MMSIAAAYCSIIFMSKLSLPPLPPFVSFSSEVSCLFWLLSLHKSFIGCPFVICINGQGQPSPGAYKPPTAKSGASKLPPGFAEAPSASPLSKNTKKKQNRKAKQNESGVEQQVGSESVDQAEADLTNKGEKERATGDTQRDAQASANPKTEEKLTSLLGDDSTQVGTFERADAYIAG